MGGQELARLVLQELLVVGKIEIHRLQRLPDAVVVIIVAGDRIAGFDAGGRLTSRQ
jgi:hypothetical protein